jgi:hypothetical protein
MDGMNGVRKRLPIFGHPRVGVLGLLSRKNLVSIWKHCILHCVFPQKLTETSNMAPSLKDKIKLIRSSKTRKVVGMRNCATNKFIKMYKADGSVTDQARRAGVQPKKHGVVKSKSRGAGRCKLPTQRRAHAKK